ncbi:uncharacterized protein N7515_001344 [Penicillium bovifimosum]|uniref:F-box domain-containing protein n=1 Tax=Penicillium bovifimosum TaxID=126998 RepID=A0A9W9H9H3_9EURO|nr:uncharacterized protein N7515_001344 [Penicillium bovifimosum]KAJ5142557.1 hypothetical protein N7515_001344 [Penicillium bovifimosum]
MAPSLLSLPRELRIEIFKYLLVQREPVEVVNVRNPHRLERNILYTNKLFLVEGRPLLYGHNRFHFGRRNSNLLITKFLDAIGSINAPYLRNIYMDFPEVREIEGEVSLVDVDLHVLEIIQSKCTNLQTLTTTVETTTNMEAWLNYFGSPNCFGRPILDKTLDLIAAHFRAIPSLPKIILEVYEGRPTPREPSLDIREKMESLGWTLEVVPGSYCVASYYDRMPMRDLGPGMIFYRWW